MKSRQGLYVALLVFQIICAALFFVGFLSTVLGLFKINWALYELIEIAAAIGLVVGAGVGGIMLRDTLRRQRQVEDQLRAASGAFMELLQERFDGWSLTPAERDVALFSIKGMSMTEIASLRGVSEGTIKAQTNAIYRKAGVSGRTQLLSLFIDELIVEPPMPAS